MSEIRDTDLRPFFDLAFDRMLAKAAALGPDVNRRPVVDDANSVFQIITHCVGMARWWLDHAVLGNPTTRDRASEFTAEGSAAELDELVSRFRRDLNALLPAVLATDVPQLSAPAAHGRVWPWTTTAIVLHVIEELFQHAGHVDVTTDLVLRDGR